jgi:hypothetical protein
MFVHAPYKKAQLIEANAGGDGQPEKVAAPGASDPFVVTKHQPSNDRRAMGHKTKRDAGSEDPIR